jgi:hypothetical protein
LRFVTFVCGTCSRNPLKTFLGSEACQWYNTLSALAESLVEARRELFEKSVEEITPIDASGDTLTGAESADSLLCKKPGWL